MRKPFRYLVKSTIYSLAAVLLLYCFFGDDLTNIFNKPPKKKYFKASGDTETYVRDIPEGTDIVVIGGGLTGAVLAYLHATVSKHTVFVVDKRDHIGGNCFDFTNKLGIRVSQYGHHVFHTNNKKTWDFVSQVTDWIPYESRLMGYVDDKYVPLPPNIDTVNLITGSSISTTGEMKRWIDRKWVSSISSADAVKGNKAEWKSRQMDFHRKIIEPFARDYLSLNKEGWEEMFKEKFAIRNNWESRYHRNDRYQGIPRDGYTAIINKLLSHSNITVHLGWTFSRLNHSLSERTFLMLYYTGMVDEYFRGQGLPRLRYSSVKLETIHLQNTTFFQPAPVVYYLQGPNKFSKITEYKHFTNLSSDSTTIVKETFSNYGIPLFPINNQENRILCEKYRKLAQKEERQHNVRFVGGMGEYKYFDMGTSVSNAVDIFERLFKHSVKPESKVERQILPSLSLVVNHCMENISWIEEDFEVECNQRKMNVFIYEKCNELSMGQVFQNSLPRCNVRQLILPNVGREGHTWIHHLLTQSVYFQDINIFLQGEKESSTYDVMNSLSHYGVPEYLREENTIDTPLRDLIDTFTMLRRQGCANDWLRYLPKMGPGLCHWFKELTGTTNNCLNFQDSRRGEMIVSDALLRRAVSRNTKFLVDMYHALSHDNKPFEGYLMERLWVVFFRWPYLRSCYTGRNATVNTTHTRKPLPNESAKTVQHYT